MKIIFRIAVIVLLVALLVSVLFRNKQKIIVASESAKQVVNEIPVEVTPVIMERPVVIVRSAGIAESSEEVIVISTVQGAVKSVDAVVGKQVKQGDLLVTADDYFAIKEYAIAKEAFDQIQKDYERSRQLSEEDAVTGQQLEQLKIQLDGANTKQLTLQRRLEDTRIKAPVSGTVNQVFVKKGGVLGTGSPVCEIVNPSGLKVTAHVPERDLDLIEKGQPVLLSENSGAGNTSEGVVAGLGVKPDRTGLYPVNIAVINMNGGIKPGMLLNAEISVSAQQAVIVIPGSIIRSIEGVKGVFVSEDNRAVFREIVTGKKYNDKVEVISGIKEGALLVTNGYQFLKKDDHLKIVKD
jgi:membrane fusion protein, multidrug efflux system